MVTAQAPAWTAGVPPASDGAIDAASPAVQAVRALLANVPDPEIPAVSVIDLGIVRDVSALRVLITPTYTGCPATLAIEQAIRAALDGGGFADVAIETTLSPPWSTDWISDRGREKLRAYGIAPPSRGGGKRALFAAGEEIACPRCGSPATERLSEFGSTACKALWRCTSCREPFDYFKCI